MQLQKRLHPAMETRPRLVKPSLPPHPAAVVQRHPATVRPTALPPHPATVVRLRPAMGAPVSGATAVQRSSMSKKLSPGEFSHVLAALALGIPVPTSLLDQLTAGQSELALMVRSNLKAADLKGSDLKSFNAMDGFVCKRYTADAAPSIALAFTHHEPGRLPKELRTLVDAQLPKVNDDKLSVIIRLRPCKHSSPILSSEVIEKLRALARTAGIGHIIFLGKQPTQSALRYSIPSAADIVDFTVDNKTTLAAIDKVASHFENQLTEEAAGILAEHLLLSRLCQRFSVVAQFGAKSGYLDLLAYPIIGKTGIKTYSIDSTDTNGRLKSMIDCGILNVVQVKATSTKDEKLSDGSAIVIQAIDPAKVGDISTFLSRRIAEVQQQRKDFIRQREAKAEAKLQAEVEARRAERAREEGTLEWMIEQGIGGS
ncbi:hypothetical protein WMF28_33615 [Sorangium sp. So ce590]|uniref:hypothetical protein n=1 Tax=Sorangium sp. So ce590 TaxID=3133317 RepID=UPI003F62A499